MTTLQAMRLARKILRGILVTHQWDTTALDAYEALNAAIKREKQNVR